MKYYDITEIPEDVTVTISKNGYGKEYWELKKENELLKEELKELKDGIIGVYNNMNALEIINKREFEEVEKI